MMEPSAQVNIDRKALVVGILAALFPVFCCVGLGLMLGYNFAGFLQEDLG